MNDNQNPVASVAKEQRGEPNVVTLVSGVRVRLVPVPASMIDAVTSRVKDPEIPMFYNADMQRDEPNPLDPIYQRQLSEAARKRGLAAIDAMSMFGIELVDGMPEDEGWLQKLQAMERRDLLDLSEFNLEDEVDREFVYKKYVVATTDLLRKLTELSGVSEEDVAAAEKSFRGNAQ
jgi:hypothetical protein